MKKSLKLPIILAAGGLAISAAWAAVAPQTPATPPLRAGTAAPARTATPAAGAKTQSPAAPVAAAPAYPQLVAALPRAVPDKGVRRVALLRGLDKVKGTSTDITAPAGVPVTFGSLAITLRTCHTVPPEEPPETTAFLQIDETKNFDPKTRTNVPKRMFSGWMFASTPALNALEHPVYDVWVITCRTDAPETVASTAVAPVATGAPPAPVEETAPAPTTVAPGTVPATPPAAPDAARPNE
jgi:hypothetical protein